MLGLCATVVKHYLRCWISSTSSDSADDVIMLDANYISERLSNLKNEMSDLGGSNARYWKRKSHTPLQKSASALRHDRLVEIKLELADMMKRCA
jgi:hypothetical protein